MPSQLHEALLFLFRSRPQLAPELLRSALHAELPNYTDVRIESADLSEPQPVEYRADLVVLLYDGVPVLGIIVEVQLHRDPDKVFAWPAYVTGLRARIRCPVQLLVVTHRDAIARWAARRICLGGANFFSPVVLGPSGVPVVTDVDVARADPELAVLSAMAHGAEADTEQAARIAIAAIAAAEGLDADRSALYFDLIQASLSRAARKALRSMEPGNYEYQSAFARRYFAKGKAKGEASGEARGKVDLVLRLLARRFGPLTLDQVERVRAASAEDLDRFADRLLVVEHLSAVFD